MSSPWKSIRYALAAALATALLTTTPALAGSGVGSVFNLGQTNSVDGTSTLTGNTAGPQLNVRNKNTGKPAVQAQAGDGSGIALYGLHTTSAGAGPAVKAQSASTAGGAFSLYSLLTPTSPGSASAAIRARSNSTSTKGYGLWASQAGTGAGVLSTSAKGIGVWGRHLGSTGTGAGVRGDSASGGAPGLLGETASTATGATGVLGQVTSTAAGPVSAGVRAFNYSTGANGAAVIAEHFGSGIGVYGDTVGGVGVFGWHTGATGAQPGLQGDTSAQADGAVGVLGRVLHAHPARGSAGVRGENFGTPGLGYAIGVSGRASTGIGVVGDSVSGRGVYGAATGTSGVNYGVYGGTESPSGYAGYFQGRVRVTGELAVAGAYAQLPTRTGAPPATACDSAAEAGRIVVRTDGSVNLYICRGIAGWIGK